MTDRIETLAVHAGAEPDEISGGVSPSIQMSTTFRQDGVGKPRRGYEYGRSGNPTRQALEAAIASLEGGVGALLVASGQAWRRWPSSTSPRRGTTSLPRPPSMAAPSTC